MTDTISVVIPAKNEQRGLDGLLPKLKALDCVDEILVIDDGSDDNTRQVCETHQVRVISHPYSMGNGAAIKTGAREARGSVLVFMDADGQHSPDYIPVLLERYRQGYQMVVGARNNASQASVTRLTANTFYNLFASWIVGRKVEDLTSGFRVVNAEKFREFLPLLPNGFSYPTTSTMAFFRAGYPLCYEPIEALAREGKSHIRLLRDGIRFLLIIFKIGTLYSPLKVFFPFSVFQLAIGLLYYAFTYITEGRFTNMSAVLMTSAITAFLIGLVSEQITMLLYTRTGGEKSDG